MNIPITTVISLACFVALPISAQSDPGVGRLQALGLLPPQTAQVNRAARGSEELKELGNNLNAARKEAVEVSLRPDVTRETLRQKIETVTQIQKQVAMVRYTSAFTNVLPTITPDQKARMTRVSEFTAVPYKQLFSKMDGSESAATFGHSQLEPLGLNPEQMDRLNQELRGSVELRELTKKLNAARAETVTLALEPSAPEAGLRTKIETVTALQVEIALARYTGVKAILPSIPSDQRERMVQVSVFNGQPYKELFVGTDGPEAEVLFGPISLENKD